MELLDYLVIDFMAVVLPELHCRPAIAVLWAMLNATLQRISEVIVFLGGCPSMFHLVETGRTGQLHCSQHDAEAILTF